MEKTNPKEPSNPSKSNAAELKNAANLKKALAQVLLAFEKNKEWADYGHWLQKVAKILEENPSVEIPEKLTFGKRLAQCLNPNLPPAIHSNAIQVYSIIFRNFREGGYNWCEDLGLFSIGLFPIFQYASFQVKPKILALYRDHYFPLGKQLIPCITGLSISILPGIEEQNEALQKNVFATLDQLSDTVSKKYFIGAVWMAILRNPKVRQAGIKYLSKRLKRTFIDPDEENENEGSDSETEESPVKQPEKFESPPKKEEIEEQQEEQPEEQQEEEQLENQEQIEGGQEGQVDDEGSVSDDEGKAEGEGEVEGGEQGEGEGEKEKEVQKSKTVTPVKKEVQIVLQEPVNFEEFKQTATEEEAFLLSLEQGNEDELSVEYPNKSSLVLNALIAGMTDENASVQKATLDFLHTHFKLASPLFTEREKNILLEVALSLLIKKDQQLLRRVYVWIFGPPDMDNKYQVTEKNENVLELVINSFTKLFNKVPRDAIQATLPLKALQNFYMEHDHLIEQTLPSLAIPFLSYISKYSKHGSPFSEEIHKAGTRFMENITSYFSVILTSLSHSLEMKIQEQNSQSCLDIINLIEFTFKLDASILNKEENINYVEQKDYLKAIISGILRSTSSVNPDQKELIPFVETAYTLNLNLIDKLETIEKGIYKFIAERHLTEAEVARIMQPSQADFGFEESLKLFGDFYERLVKAIFHYQTENQIPQRLLNLFAVASEMVIKVQVFHTETAIKTFPSWLHSVIRCIKSPFPAVSIIGIKTIQSLLIFKSNKPIYDSIRQLITTSEGSQNKTDDIVGRTTEKLWGLLDVHYIQNTVSDLLVTFQSHFPSVFAETVVNSFNVPSITEKEAAIRRFSSFWKLSSDLAKSSFIENGTGLFIILEFLDNDNPLLRHSSKSWLLDSITFLYRIIDPIFENLMQCDARSLQKDKNHHLNLYTTETQQYLFTEVYDTELVQDSFRKLRSILITANELFTRYIISIKVSEKLRKHKAFFETHGMENPETTTYLDVLTILCLRYIQGHAIESLSLQFQIQNASVNASASEFMELLITHIENKELSAKITHQIMEPLTIVLHHSIASSDYVLQVQILNLMKVILYQSSFCTYEGKKVDCINLLSSSRFVPNLLKGLSVDQPYVRVQFINFVSSSVSILTENLTQKEVLTNSVLSIIKAYFEIILSKKLEVSENNDEFEPWEANNANFEDPANRKLDISPGDEKKSPEPKAVRNTFAISRNQNQNEIYTLLEGVKKILDYFLKFSNASDLQETRVFYGAEGPGIFTIMKDMLTQGFTSHVPELKKEAMVSITHSETTKALIGFLLKIVYILIHCWRLSKEFRQTADFTSIGITSYTFEKYNDINKMINNYHLKIDPTAKNVKSLVISVLKPLTYQYTNETINAFINYWMKECERKQDLSLNPRMMKEIEILVCMNISIEMFITTLSKNQILLDLHQNYLNKQKQNKKGPIILNYDDAKTESQIFFLLYTYLSYAYIDMNQLKKDYLSKLWNTFLNFTKLFSASKAISTHFWLLELFQLLALKYNPKEILGDNKIKKEMHGQINALLISIANFCAKNTTIYFNDPTGASEATKFRTVLPFPPTIYEIYKKYKIPQKKIRKIPTTNTENIENSDPYDPENIQIERLMFQDFESDTSEVSLYDRYRLFGFKILKQIGLTVLQNSYSPERIDRIIVRSKEFMNLIFPLMQNKSIENQSFLECASELLYAQLDASRSFLLKDYKKDILDVFNGNDFFKCSKQTLKYWSKIIDWVTLVDKGDIFMEFLTKWVSTFSFFTSKDSETKNKIKSFERICFIIYSGERDKYQEKLIDLLEKIGEIIKNAESAHPSLLILVLFCFRVLILRLSPSALSELFGRLWPILLTLLMQIFSRKGPQKNPNLTLSGLKLLEMMSILQLEEFYLNQWVFVYDYFGLTFEVLPENQKRISTEPEGAETKPPKISGFIYQPYLANVMPENLSLNYKSKQLEVQKNHEKLERKMVMTMTHVNDESEIKTKALVLMQYLMKQNEFRTEVDPQQIESLIEGDFISLDEYIFNIN